MLNVKLVRRTAFPFRRPQRQCTKRFFLIFKHLPKSRPKRNDSPVLLRNAIKLADIVLGLVLIVTIPKLALRCLLGQQGAFYIC
jgi:hypothetical protein